MKTPAIKITLLFFFITIVNLINAQCHYVIDMQDSWGDGWNGASVEVNINGTFATSISLAGGNAGMDSITTLNNDLVDFSFVSGNWDSELSFQIYDPLGNQIFNQPQFANNDGNDTFLLSDTSNSTCVPQFVNVTFQVDMSKVTSSFTHLKLAEVGIIFVETATRCLILTGTKFGKKQYLYIQEVMNINLVQIP